MKAINWNNVAYISKESTSANGKPFYLLRIYFLSKELYQVFSTHDKERFEKFVLEVVPKEFLDKLFTPLES